MRRLPGILLLLFGLKSHSQADPLLLEAKMTYLGSRIDSLASFIASGQATSFANNCLLPGHATYFVKGSAMGFSSAALNVSGKARTDYVRMYALAMIATDRYLQQDYKGSSLCWKQALALARANDFDFEELHNYRPALNNNCFLTGDYTGAMKISTEGLEKAESIQDRERIAHFTNVIGYIHMKQGNFAESHRYYTSYLQQTRALQNKSLQAHALANLGDLAATEQNYSEAISLFRQSLKMYQTLYAGFNLDPKEREAYLSDKLAGAFKQMQDYRTALQYASTAIALTRQASCNEYDIARYYINTGTIYNRLQYADSALAFLRQGLAAAHRIRYREELRNVYEQLAISFAQVRRFDSAFYYQGLFSRLKDSIANENSNREILQREASLQIQQQKRLQQAELDRQQLWRNIIIGIALMVILVLFLLYNRYRIRQKMKYQQQLNRQQNEMFNLAASVQEKERKRIAEDIHDSLGSVLSAAKLKLSTLENEEPMSEAQRKKYQDTLALLDEAAAELRNISHNIMPATLSRLGLVAAIRNLADNLSSHSRLAVRFEAHGFESRLDESTEISIYRIVLELLNNIVKHAEATKATIQLIRYPDYINVTVDDNGKGFDYNVIAEESRGIGLGSIASRVNYLTGRIDIDAVPGRGTTVIIDIPYAL